MPILSSNSIRFWRVLKYNFGFFNNYVFRLFMNIVLKTYYRNACEIATNTTLSMHYIHFILLQWANSHTALITHLVYSMSGLINWSLLQIMLMCGKLNFSEVSENKTDRFFECFCGFMSIALAFIIHIMYTFSHFQSINLMMRIADTPFKPVECFFAIYYLCMHTYNFSLASLGWCCSARPNFVIKVSLTHGHCVCAL